MDVIKISVFQPGPRVASGLALIVLKLGVAGAQAALCVSMSMA